LLTIQSNNQNIVAVIAKHGKIAKLFLKELDK